MCDRSSLLCLVILTVGSWNSWESSVELLLRLCGPYYLQSRRRRTTSCLLHGADFVVNLTEETVQGRNGEKIKPRRLLRSGSLEKSSRDSMRFDVSLLGTASLGDRRVEA